MPTPKRIPGLSADHEAISDTVIRSKLTGETFPVRSYGNQARFNDGTFQIVGRALVKLGGEGAAPAVDPVVRVTIEFDSGRREVVE